MTFKLKCYHDLKRSLGVFDAAIQFNELGRLELNGKLTASSTQK